MVRPLRWQIGIGLCGSLIILVLLRSLALATASTAPALRSRVYIEGVAGVPLELNPLLQTSAGPDSEEDLTALLFEGLTRIGPDGVPVPALADNWDIGASGTVYTFTLRSGLHWHDGVSLTADDVAFTVQAVQSSDFAGDAAVVQLWRNVRVGVIDDLRVRFELNAPYAPFLATTTLPIVPRHLLGSQPQAGWATAPFSRNPVGSGPFRLHALDANEAMLVPFEGAVRGRPKLDLLVLRFYSSLDQARAALRRNEIHGVAFGTIGQPDSLAPTIPLHVLRIPLAHTTQVALNLRVWPLSSQQIRVALAQALDRGVLLQRTFGMEALPLESPIPPQTPFHGEAGLPDTAPQVAEQTLEDSGWRRGQGGIWESDGSPLRLPLLCVDTPAQVELARELARQWRLIGVDVTVEALPRAQVQTRLQGHEFALVLQSWIMPTADPDLFALWHSSQATTGANYAGLQDERIDTLLAEGRTTTDLTTRTALYHEFEQRWTTLLPAIPLYQSMLTYELASTVRPAGLEQTRLLTTRASRFDMISEWSVTNQE